MTASQQLWMVAVVTLTTTLLLSWTPQALTAATNDRDECSNDNEWHVDAQTGAKYRLLCGQLGGPLGLDSTLDHITEPVSVPYSSSGDQGRTLVVTSEAKPKTSSSCHGLNLRNARSATQS